VCVAIISFFIFGFVQDVTSYIIARTLGVIDDTKASTSDRESLHTAAVAKETYTEPPSIIVQSASIAGSMPTTPSIPVDTGRPLDGRVEKLQFGIAGSHSQHQSSSTSSLYEGNPALAGVGVFSPAASTPPSPTIERRRFGSLSNGITPFSPLEDETGSNEKVITDGEGEEEILKSRVGRKGSWGSMSAGLDSSYALVDKDSGSEDSGVLLRRRQKVPTMEPIGS